jgi:hypothetical protein
MAVEAEAVHRVLQKAQMAEAVVEVAVVPAAVAHL